MIIRAIKKMEEEFGEPFVTEQEIREVIEDAYSQGKEETSKSKDEEFIKILGELKLNLQKETIKFADYPIIHQIIHLEVEEIKQKLEGGK